MADDLPSLVNELYDEGVVAGKEEGERIKAEAVLRAEKIIETAKAEAARIKRQGLEEAQKTKAATTVELKLIARDVMLNLRQQVADSLHKLLMEQAKDALQDDATLGALIQMLVAQFLESDFSNNGQLALNLNEAHFETVHAKLMALLASDDRARILFKNELALAGFEYKVREYTVEVTEEAIAAQFDKFITTKTRKLLEEVIRDKDDT